MYIREINVINLIFMLLQILFVVQNFIAIIIRVAMIQLKFVYGWCWWSDNIVLPNAVVYISKLFYLMDII